MPNIVVGGLNFKGRNQLNLTTVNINLDFTAEQLQIPIVQPNLGGLTMAQVMRSLKLFGDSNIQSKSVLRISSHQMSGIRDICTLFQQVDLFCACCVCDVFQTRTIAQERHGHQSLKYRVYKLTLLIRESINDSEYPAMRSDGYQKYF